MSVMNHSIRQILPFPGTAIDGHVSAVAIPASERFGSGLIAESASGNIGSLVVVPNPTTPQIARHALAIADSHNGEPFAGLGLAPDSLFEAFTVHVGEFADDLNQHRVSAGNPMLGALDFVEGMVTVGVTLPVSIAPIAANGQPSTIAAGATSAVDLPSGGKILAWPLPIEICYGASLPQRGDRTTYHDRVTVVHDNDGQMSQVHFVTDGRQDVEIQIVSPAPSGNAGVRIIRLDGRTQDSRFDNADASLVIGEDGEDVLSVPLNVGMNRFPIPGRAPTMMSVQIDGQRTPEVNKGTYQISIVAR